MSLCKLFLPYDCHMNFSSTFLLLNTVFSRAKLCTFVNTCAVMKAVDLSCIRRPHPPHPDRITDTGSPAPGRNSKHPRAIHQNMGTSTSRAVVQMCLGCVVCIVSVCADPQKQPELLSSQVLSFLAHVG